MKQKVKELISKINFENIFILFIILQPIIDILTSLCVRNISEKLTLGIFIRAAFMLYIMIYTIIKVDKKSRWQILIYYSCIAIYSIAFMINSYTKYGLTMIVAQVKGLIKTFYFPIILASLLMIFKKNEYSSKQKYLNISLAIYVLTVVVCKIFSVGYETYPMKPKAGTIGLFYAGNETSAIIAMLAPICFAAFISNKFSVLNAILCVLTVFAMLEIGTKVAFVSTAVLIILTLILSVIKLIKKEVKGFYKQFITLLLIGLLTFLFVGNTSVGKNLNINPILLKKQITAIEPEEAEEETEEKDVNTDPTVLLSGRNNFFKSNLKKYNNASISDKSVGLGYIAPKKDVIQERKLVEIDYFDIFFCHGILGTLIYIIPLAALIMISIKNFFTKFVNNMKNHTLILMIYSVLIGFGIALMAGHVFTAPAVSMFLILSMLEMFRILKNKKDSENE